ncbi:hypothetical protein [Oleomonas cavernae]|uniref:hypothetical protein n=1 Tax=Oleomonas cavernae TaxID=2320859 RepID=UPI001F400187|nr:hypothetical protein [Oleomonas cavernae]
MSRRRIDPRAGLDARRVSGGARARFTIEAAARPEGDRPRRDPRAERAAQTTATGARLRLDRSLPLAGGHAPVAQAIQATNQPAPERVIIDDPAFLVLVVADAANDRLLPHDRQILGQRVNSPPAAGRWCWPAPWQPRKPVPPAPTA